MCGFITNSGTIYYLDSKNRLFSGGKFKTPVAYTSASAIIGNKATIVLIDGRIVTTSTVMRYF